jgi:hypothetical protein
MNIGCGLIPTGSTCACQFAFSPTGTEFTYWCRKIFNDMICTAQLQQVQSQDNVQSLWINVVHSWVSFSVLSSLHSRSHCHEQTRAHYSNCLTMNCLRLLLQSCVALLLFLVFKPGPMVSVCMISLRN